MAVMLWPNPYPPVFHRARIVRLSVRKTTASPVEKAE